MPSKSKAQRRKMRILHAEGKITKEQEQHFEKLVPNAPERKGSKKPKKSRKK